MSCTFILLLFFLALSCLLCCPSGWADTPAVRTSMPDFYNRTKHVLRSAEQGADTIIWLCISSNVSQHPNGSFFQDRNPVPKHLPLAWTKSSLEEENELMVSLDAMSNKFEGNARL